MVARDIASSSVGDMTNIVKDFSGSSETTDSGRNEPWFNTKFNTYLWYYKNIPELKSTIDTKSKWVIGKGLTADKKTIKILEKIKGFGKDTINTLIQNGVKVYYVGGDSFWEIITKENKPIKPDGSNLINLKPMDPFVTGIVTDEFGMLQGYEQRTKGEDRHNIKFRTDQIFHLPKNRFADEIHGTGIITAIENIILMRNEAMSDLKTVFHRYVKPLWIWQLDTDDTTKIAAFQAKADKTVNLGENIYIPMGAASAERMSVPQFSTLDPLPWIRDLTDYFYQATNTPDVVVGSAKQTVEASAKILFLGFEQSVRDDQQFIMENFKSQLGLDIKLEFPTPIEADLIRDEKKDGDNVKASDKADTTEGSGK